MTGPGPRRVLVVDDEPRLLALLEMLLEDAGFDVTSATSGPEAVMVLSRETFGVAVVDKNLSADMSGLDVLRKAKELQPFLQVLIHTAYPSTDSAVEALKSGAFDYIQKPTDNTMLVAQVERAWEAYALSKNRNELLQDYEALFETIPGIVWFTNADGSFRRVSAAGASSLEYSASDLVGERYDVLLDPNDDHEKVHEVFRERRVYSRSPARRLVTLKTRNGAKRLFEVSACASYDDDHTEGEKQYRGTLAVGWDITESLRLFNELHQARQMNDLGRIAGGVAHEFNNLLTVMINSATYGLSTVDADHEAARQLTMILEAAHSATDMTRMLMTFSRSHDVAKAEIDVAGLLESAGHVLARTIEAPVRVEISPEPDLWSVLADAKQMQQVIVNLANNAKDAMPQGGSLVVRAYNHVGDPKKTGAAADDSVVIEVVDHGTGMTDSVRERALEPFFTTKPVGEGTGLGLAMVHSVVSRCGGHVELISKVDVGTTARIYLPRAVTASKDAAPIPQPVNTTPGQKTVLLVEDNELVRTVARRILERGGYSVIEADDTTSALQAWAAASTIDVVLTDVIMPGRSGIQLVDELRSTEPNIPVVLMSGHIGNLEQAMTAMDARTAFLQKPFKGDQLLAEIQRVLDSSTAT